MAAGAYSGTLNNCLLTNNSAGGYYAYGGGAYGSTLNHCTIVSDSATTYYYYGSAYGGGACSSTLNACTLAGNSASCGGGTSGSTLNTCTLVGNSASSGGGSYQDMLNNCLIISNSAAGSGGGAYGSTLNACALAGNSAASGGGGTYESTLNRCTLAGNSANDGGGSCSDVLNNCLIVSNSGYYYGGGTYSSTLNNCTIVSNSVSVNYGGGACYSTLSNCIVYYNTAPGGPNYTASTLDHCCTTPDPGGAGNIMGEPAFIDLAGHNLRLQTNSPCINAGNNTNVVGSTDLDGRPRIVGGIVDMGAYEFQGPGLGEFFGWLQFYGLPTDGSADYADSDGDGSNNWQEWIAGTNPTNALSVLRMLAPSNSVSGVTVTWQSVTSRTYFLDRGTNLLALPPFSILASNIVGQVGTTSYLDTNAVDSSTFFYRVGVQ
jgi:hypothetical protein